MAVAASRKRDEITHLEYPENVRTRPTMYIGSCGPDGLMHCLLEILHNAVDEHAAGHARRIAVTLHPDGASVSDDGRGVPAERHSTGVNQLELAMTRLHAGSKFFQRGDSHFSSGMNGVGASCVNALSKRFVVWSKRSPSKRPVKLMCREGVKLFLGPDPGMKMPWRTGTTVRFIPDPDIFETVAFDIGQAKAMCSDAAYLNPRLSVTFASGEESAEYRQPGGLSAYVADLAAGRTPVTAAPLSLESEGVFTDRRKHSFRYRLACAFTFVEEQETILRTFVNNVRTDEGGSHVDGLLAGLRRAVLQRVKDTNIRCGVAELRPEDVTASGLCGVLAFSMQEPRFASQTKRKLTNSEVAPAVSEAVHKSVLGQMSASPTLDRALMKRAIANAVRRERGEDSRSVRKMDTRELAGKLSPCSSRDPARRELWLVEGDSAGGTANMGRDATFQAVLPLRGKILNVEKANLRKALEHREIKALIAALGCGIAYDGKRDDFDIAGLNYHKVIIATDADVDGSHIACLLLAFFWRFLRPLLTGGYVYLACPPLYRVGLGKKVKYLADDAALERLRKRRQERGLDNRLLSVQRYKGLGEMNAEQFGETTMDPATRALRRVTVPDAEAAEATIDLLLGTDVEARRSWIGDNAASASLDV